MPPMTAYPRRKERLQCATGKVVYESIERAEATTAIMQVRLGAQFRVYGCPSCGCYHITSLVDRADRYEQLDIKGELLKAVEDKAAAIVDRPSHGVTRYSHNGYVFLYSPNGRSTIIVERSPEATDMLLFAVQSGLAKLVRKISNSTRVFEYKVKGKVYTFTYNKERKEIVIDSVIGASGNEYRLVGEK